MVGKLRRPLLRWVVFVLGAFYGVCTFALFTMRFFSPPSTSVKLQRQFEALLTARPYNERSIVVPLGRLDPHLVHAVIAAEDARFFQHHGIDWVELQKVLVTSWRQGRFVRGGSTITQQLVKNLFLTTYGSVVRKALELTLAPLAELLLSKERILELYLNIVEWGPGVYGAEAATRYHYGISASYLNRQSAARLAACLPAPRTRIPQHMDRLGAEILDRMQSMGW
ncbi:MAG TPA: monofunctional biosynthetic peptidoglycan transglycosylase [Candidatus Binatia bacterium]|nr:monofunctional biosynthetic peptidoglycan transglycosylase [Candidatus Binatia bacterium]